MEEMVAELERVWQQRIIHTRSATSESSKPEECKAATFCNRQMEEDWEGGSKGALCIHEVLSLNSKQFCKELGMVLHVWYF